MRNTDNDNSFLMIILFIAILVVLAMMWIDIVSQIHYVKRLILIK